MREIEVKTRVESIAAIVERLEAEGVEVSAPVTQRDEVFGVPGADGDGDNSAPWLRIRTETRGNDTKYIYTLKKSVTSQLDSIEHETEVDDPDELRQIILHSGFEPYSDLTKTRRKAKVDGNEICIDSVEQLGEFVEAEKLTSDDADAAQVIDELWALLERYGANRKDGVTDGYDVLMERLRAVA